MAPWTLEFSRIPACGVQLKVESSTNCGCCMRVKQTNSLKWSTLINPGDRGDVTIWSDQLLSPHPAFGIGAPHCWAAGNSPDGPDADSNNLQSSVRCSIRLWRGLNSSAPVAAVIFRMSEKVDHDQPSHLSGSITVGSGSSPFSAFLAIAVMKMVT